MDAKPPQHKADGSDGTLSKSEFAAFISVSAGRVSQYIADGKLSGDALVWVDGFQRVKVDVAIAQLRERLDPSQMTGNGKKTRLALQQETIAVSTETLVRLEATIAARFDNARDEVLRILRVTFGNPSS